jgi:hypothetical protein
MKNLRSELCFSSSPWSEDSSSSDYEEKVKRHRGTEKDDERRSRRSDKKDKKSHKHHKSSTSKKSKDDKPKKKHTESDHKLVSSNLPFEIVTHKNIYLYIHLKSQKYIALETLYVWFFAGLFSCLVMV